MRTSRGDEKVIANDIFRERVTLRGADGEVRLLGLEDLRVELDTAGTGALYPQVVADEPETVDIRCDSEEESELTSGVDIIVDDETPHSDVTSSAAAVQDDTPASGGTVVAEAARKPHRRRGRRGGRRNRAGRERGENGSDSGGAAPQDA